MHKAYNAGADCYPRKGHSPASGWSHDDASHWHACLNGCGTQLDKAAHDTNGADGACSVCGYKEGHIHSLTRQQYTGGCAKQPRNLLYLLGLLESVP